MKNQINKTYFSKQNVHSTLLFEIMKYTYFKSRKITKVRSFVKVSNFKLYPMALVLVTIRDCKEIKSLKTIGTFR